MEGEEQLSPAYLLWRQRGFRGSVLQMSEGPQSCQQRAPRGQCQAAGLQPWNLCSSHLQPEGVWEAQRELSGDKDLWLLCLGEATLI